MPWRDASTYGSLTTASKTAVRSVMTLPPQSCEISSTNFWPKPVDPRGLGATTTQPCAAQSVGFQRADHPSPHAPCGPPWIRNTTAYLRRGLKFGGLTIQYWTGAPAAPGTVKLSGGLMFTFCSQPTFSPVTGVATGGLASASPPGAGKAYTSAGATISDRENEIMLPRAFGALIAPPFAICC